MPLNEIYRKDAPFIISVDWTDAITGNGYITLYGGVAPSSLATYESYTTGDDADTFSIDNSGAQIAQTFTIGTTGTDTDFWATKIRFKSRIPDPLGTCEIQEVTAGEPNGTVKLRLAVDTKVIESGANDWFEIDLTSSEQNDGESLKAGTQYALVFIGPAIATDLRKDDNDATYTGGVIWTTPDFGANWTEQTGDDLMFEVKGNLVNPYTLSTTKFVSAFLSTTVNHLPASTDIDTEMGRVIFETAFNQTAIIEGIAFVSYQYTSVQTVVNSKAEIWHIRGATETKIGDSESFLDDKTPSLQIDLTRTTMNPGDRIKLKIILTYLDAGTINSSTLLHDPNTAGNEVILKLPIRTS